jgi:DNA-binding NarL/FixJ family response regulator
MMIKILICDDQDLVCEGLRAILSTAQDMQVVGVAYDGAQVLEMVSHTRPDLVLMDLKMPVMNGIQATRRLRQQHPEIKVLVLTTYAEDQWVFDAIRSGAAGYLLKDTPREGLIQAIKDTVAGKTPVDPEVAGQLFTHISQGGAKPESSILAELSSRELEVLKLLARGLSNADIAECLNLSEGTVRNYVSSIFLKLEVTDRTKAAVLAIRYGVVDEWD